MIPFIPDVNNGSPEFWEDMAAQFLEVRQKPGGDKLTAVHKDGFVIQDVAGASYELCKQLAAEARARKS